MARPQDRRPGPRHPRHRRDRPDGGFSAVSGLGLAGPHWVTLPRQISLADLIRRFRELGWEGPISGGKHRFMRKGQHKVRIPNPHASTIDLSLLAEILRQ